MTPHFALKLPVLACALLGLGTASALAGNGSSSAGHGLMDMPFPSAEMSYTPRVVYGDLPQPTDPAILHPVFADMPHPDTYVFYADMPAAPNASDYVSRIVFNDIPQAPDASGYVARSTFAEMPFPAKMEAYQPRTVFGDMPDADAGQTIIQASN